MLLPSVFSTLLVTVLASPLLQSEGTHDYAAEQRVSDLLGDTVVGDNGQEYLDEDVDESRLLTSGSSGDYTLVSIPWGQGTALSFNDTAASTLSTLGNAALLVGGLYLLSGFPGAALADPFGLSRRFGQPALPGPAPPRFQRIQHKTGMQHKPGKQGKGKVSKRKSMKAKRRPVERRGPAMAKPTKQQSAQERRGPAMTKPTKQQSAQERRGPAMGKPTKQQSAKERRGPAMGKPTTQQSAQERQLLRPGRLPSLPTLRPLRPLNFRMPELPSLRLPSIPTFRRPSFPQLNNPFRRPAARPRPVQQSSRPRPAPAAPASQPAPSSAPLTPSFRPSSQNTVEIAPSDSAPLAPVQNIPSQSAPLTLPDPRPAAPASFGSAFDNDPFSEFQSADFGSDASFRELIDAQFGESFDLQRLPNSRSDKNKKE